MKKLFNHTKKPYEDKWDEYEYEGIDDWDQAEEDTDAHFSDEGEEAETVYSDEVTFEQEEDYYAAEAGEEYTGEDGSYYAEEEEPEEAYYAEEEEPEESYYAEEEEPEEAYYAEEEEPEESYYAEEEEPEEASYYAEEEEPEESYYAEEEEPEEAYYAEEKKPRGRDMEDGPRGIAALWQRFLDMDSMDRIILATGVTVLVLAVITGVVFFSAKAIENQVDDFVSVGSQLDGITIIGEKGLNAVADAELERLNAELGVEDKPGYDENDYNSDVTIALNMTSIQKDLKIKFINESTDKLVPNVPFSVSVITPSNETVVWEDDDRDGVIYQKGIDPGKYQVQMLALTDTKYADYKVSATALSLQEIMVKKDIEYKKVDVGNEVKKESEINATKEDTKKNEVAVESTLTDTVAWVESTRTANTYTEVTRGNVPDPKTKVWNGSFARLALGTGNKGSVNLVLGSTTTATVSIDKSGLESSENITSVTWSSGNESIATVAGNTETATITAVAKGSTDITATITVTKTESTEGGGGSTEGGSTEGGDTSGGDAQNPTTADIQPRETTQTYIQTFSVTVAEPTPAMSIKLSSTSVTVGKDKTVEVTATAENVPSGKTPSYEVTSNETASASVNGNKITIKGLKAGTTKLTVTAKCDGATSASAEISVTVAGNNATLAIGQTAVTVFTTETVKVGATVSGATVSDVKIKATSSDTNVAEVTGEISNNGELVITGKAAGSATITVTYTENGVEIKKTCAVTVKKHPKEDKNTRLKDNSGTQLYVLENGAYREAVYADYYSNVKLFVMGSAKYTGWQTLDNKVYYFDANGNKVTGEQVIQGAKYNFASDGSLVTGSGTMGIDVSKWNGTIDWKAVKNSGVSYVIIRVGYRGSSAGALVDDPKFAANIKGANEAGLKVGIYFFSQAVDEVEAVEEASMVLDRISGYKISYPIFIDVESSGGRADSISKETRTAVCKAFCQTIQSGGYTAGVYSNKNWFTSKLDASALSAYKIWLAQYAKEPTYTGRYDLWQYKSTGRVSGISGNVDMNISYLGY